MNPSTLVPGVEGRRGISVGAEFAKEAHLGRPAILSLAAAETRVREMSSFCFGSGGKKMASSQCEQLFDSAFPLTNQTVLTVAAAPERQEELIDLLDRAMARGLRHKARLYEIHVPFERFPLMDSKFWHVPIEDSGDPQILRLFFAPSENVADEAA
jgi:hypothetical protein